MEAEEDKTTQITLPIATGNLFFAAIIYSGNQQQLFGTLQSVFRQKLSGASLDICIFYEHGNTPETKSGNYINLVPYHNKEDFFIKYCNTVDHTPARYCITLWSGDELFDGAFNSAEKIFSKHEQINWLTGIQTFQTKGGFNVTLGTTAMRRWSFTIYERNIYKNSGRYIPPASTFWRKSMWAQFSSGIHFVELKDFCEDIWLGFFKTQKLYTCKAYFSTTTNYEKLAVSKFKLPNNYSLIEDGLLERLKEFFFVNNIPYLRLFYRNGGGLVPIIRFDHATQSYFLSKY